jgi:hypothetical protein
MAPEQIENPRKVDQRADIYSLGVVFYEMLTGELPLGRFPPPSERSTADPRLDQVVLRALEKEPQRRTASAEEVKTQVATIASSQGESAVQPRASRHEEAQVRPKTPRPPLRLAILALVFILSGCSSLWGVIRDFGQHSRSIDLGILALPIGIGLLRYRPWWRLAALASIWLYFGALLLATAILFRLTGEISPNVRTIAEFAVSGKKVLVQSQANFWVALLFYAFLAALLIWSYRVLTRQNIKALFQRKGFVKPWLEWIALAGVAFVAIVVMRSTQPVVSPEVSSVPAPLGSLHLIAAGSAENLVLARAESDTGYPLHQIIARFAGPPLESNQWQQARARANGPTLAPALEEQYQGAEPVESRLLWGDFTNVTAQPSSTLFECPNECQLQFALPDPTEAQEAVRQIEIVLSHPVVLWPGTHIQLFSVGERKAWLEVREYQPIPGKLAFVPYSNRSIGRPPIPLSETGSVRCAVLSIPPNTELKVTISPYGSMLLDSGITNAGVYWLTWYAVGRDDAPAESGAEWRVYVHDGRTARQLGLIAPDGSGIEWKSSFYTAPANVSPGTTMSIPLFYGPEKNGRTTRTVLADMILDRAGSSSPNEVRQGNVLRGDSKARKETVEAARAKLQLKLAYAEKELKEARTREAVGAIPPLELEKAAAARDTILAELNGDAVEVARIHLKIAAMELTAAEQKHAVGAAADDEVAKAKLARDTAAVDLRQAEDATSPTSK